MLVLLSVLVILVIQKPQEIHVGLLGLGGQAIHHLHEGREDLVHQLVLYHPVDLHDPVILLDPFHP
jgi:hypothetical protein